MSLEGKTAIVTGASSGIGAAVTRDLRALGVRVAGGARRVERIDADVALELDVTDVESCERFVASAADELGGVDILFNSAGLALGRYPVDESNEEDEAIVLATNVAGLMRITRLCLPHIRDGGHIVNMGSIAGRQAYPSGSSYIASKFAVRGYTYALREDLLGRPIRITTVDAGLVETEFSIVRFKGDTEAAKAVYAGLEPVTADEVADCVLFALTRPPHVNIDEIVVKAIAQSSGARIVRGMITGLTILEGSTFCICDEIGDLDGKTSGLFAEDTRFLSQLELRVAGVRPLLLSSGKVEYFSAAFYLRNPVVAGLPQDTLSIVRERFIGEGMQDHLIVRNESSEPLSFELELEVGTDFADIITVKEHDFTLGHPETARPLPLPAEARFDAASNQLVLEEATNGGAKTQVLFSEPCRIDGARVCFQLDLAPREIWQLRVDVVSSLTGAELPRSEVEHRFGAERDNVRESLEKWRLVIPQLRVQADDLRLAYRQSVADLAALRMRTGVGLGRLPAAGMPWFMTVFGRDTLITSLQTMLLGPELAIASLEALTELQAHEDDASIDAEPGKILHELRRGRAAETWFGRYYGTVDATPLFLILLSEAWRWTGDAELVQRLRGPALAALGWIDVYGDRDEDGFVEYERRTPRGLENQSWKDSGDSQRFHDGSFAQGAIAPAEVQGYVYDAKLRLAELARVVWDDVPLAQRLEAEADALRIRFDDRYWVEERGGYYALALDGEKRPVDSLCSNLGHLLWSGIVPPERVETIANRLLGDELWSGWGIRTMSTADAAYNPLSYHNGTVWPHDTSLGAWGLARAGHAADVWTIASALLEAARFFDRSLPEVFAGYTRGETPFPIAYPTAARPQAWAAGTPVLLLRLLLGLEPDPANRELRTTATAAPEWIEGLELKGVRAFGRSWDVAVADGRVTVG